MNKKYCVYEHWLDGVCFYVGKGLTKTRPYKFSPSQRNQNWKAYVKDRTKDIEVKIVETFDENAQALKKETELTLYYKNMGMCQANGERYGCSSFKHSNGFYGKKHTIETKKLISKTNKGRTGEKNPFYGKKHSEQTRKILSEKRSKKIRCINLDITFNSIRECGEYFGVKNCGPLTKAMNENRAYRKIYYFEIVD